MRHSKIALAKWTGNIQVFASDFHLENTASQKNHLVMEEITVGIVQPKATASTFL